MVTVFNENAGAMKFYLEKLKYSVDETSPSRCHVDDDSTCARAPSARRAAPRRAAGVCAQVRDPLQVPRPRAAQERQEGRGRHRPPPAQLLRPAEAPPAACAMRSWRPVSLWAPRDRPASSAAAVGSVRTTAYAGMRGPRRQSRCSALLRACDVSSRVRSDSARQTLACRLAVRAVYGTCWATPTVTVVHIIWTRPAPIDIYCLYPYH